jgi:hypothetical protein
MRDPLTVSVAQPPWVSYDVAANASTAAATVRLAGTRVVVFPELFLTGYELDAPAIGVGDPNLAPIVEACAGMGSLALVGAPVDGDAGKSHIAMLAIAPPGPAWRTTRCGWARSSRTASLRATSRRRSKSTDGGSVWPSARTPASRSTPPTRPPWVLDAYLAGTLESAADAARQAERARRVATGHDVWVAVASFAGSTGGGFDRGGRPFRHLGVQRRGHRPGRARARRRRTRDAQLITPKRGGSRLAIRSGHARC